MIHARSKVEGAAVIAIDQDEYGNPVPAGSAASVTKGVGYGWVGAKQRATLDTGLLLMGARIYNPATGQFTSTDPIYGGNPTSYGYPADPVTGADVSGMCGIVCQAFPPKSSSPWNPGPKPSAPRGAPQLSDHEWDQFQRSRHGQRVSDPGAVKSADRKIHSTWKKYSGNHGKKTRGQPNKNGGKKGGGNTTKNLAVAGAAGIGFWGIWMAAKSASPACGPFVFLCALIL